MGIQGIGQSIFSNCAKYAKACGKSSILMTKPVPKMQINPFEIKSEMVGDQLVFSIDKTLNPDFLKSLLDIKGTMLEKVTQIKDKMLTVMGYDSSLVKVEYNPELRQCGMSMAINLSDGSFAIHPDILSKGVTDVQLIGLARHELDHLDKAAKTIKVKGIDAYKKALEEKVTHSGLSIDNMQFNEEFWTKISAKAETAGFDADKYLEAVKYNGVADRDAHIRTISYYTNALEKSAYNIEALVYGILDSRYMTARDSFPYGMKNIERMLSNTDIPAEKRAENLNLLFNAARIKNEPNVKELYKILTTDIYEVTAAEEETIMKLIGTVPYREQYRQYYKQVDEWLAQGITKIEDIPI